MDEKFDEGKFWRDQYFNLWDQYMADTRNYLDQIDKGGRDYAEMCGKYASLVADLERAVDA